MLNKQFLGFLDRLSRESGQKALCEAVKQGYKVCCEAVSYDDHNSDTEICRKNKYIDIQQYYNKRMDKTEFKNEVEDAGLLVDSPDAIEAEHTSQYIISILEDHLRSASAEVYPKSNEGVYLILSNGNAVQVETYANAVQFQIWHNASKMIPFGGSIILADPLAIDYDKIVKWIEKE